jgi:hypothetical protein
MIASRDPAIIEGVHFFFSSPRKVAHGSAFASQLKARETKARERLAQRPTTQVHNGPHTDDLRAAGRTIAIREFNKCGARKSQQNSRLRRHRLTDWTRRAVSFIRHGKVQRGSAHHEFRTKARYEG